MQKKIISIHAFKPAAAIRVTGCDAFEFLQGQFTNDLRSPVGSVTYGLWLNQKGKVLADSEILRVGDREFLVVSAFSEASVIIQRLEQYIIADDVALEDQTLAMSAIELQGEDAMVCLKEMMGEIPAEGRFLQAREAFVWSARNAEGFFKLLGPNEALQNLRTDPRARGGHEVGNQGREYARIAAGTPKVPDDIGPTDLPQEAGLDATAISFTKGCYLGQEVMARLHNLGQVRRQLRRVRGTGRIPLHGAPLFQNEKKVGEIRTAVATSEGFVALAMLTRMGLDENIGFTLDASTDAPSVVSLWTK